MNAEANKTRLYQEGLISIIRGDFKVDDILKLSEALLNGGVTVVEVTLNTTEAEAGIRELKRTFADEMLIGAGTVRTIDDVKLAIDAGASFLIAPCLDLASVQEASRQNVLFLPGIFTASEAQAAFVAGCQTVKLFPADAMGPAYLKALKAPLDHIDFIPTGGVNAKTIADFQQAGAVAFGVGSALVKNKAVDAETLSTLTKDASTLMQALSKARTNA